MRTFAKMVGVTITLLPILPLRLPAQVKILTDYERITIADGLSNHWIHCIFQDRRGFLWFGTNDGLNRYDGYIFKVFKYDPADSASLSNNEVGSICEDRAGKIWIGTANGLNRFDPDIETFTRYKHDPNDPNSLSGNSITALCEDRSGNLWVGLRGVVELGGLNKLVFSDPAKPMDQSQATGFSQNLLKAQNDNPAMGGAAFKSIRYKLNQNDSNNLTANWVTFIMEDHRGTFWIGTENGGLKKFEPVTEQITHYLHDAADTNSLSHPGVVRGCIDQYGELWLGFWGPGLDRFGPVTGKVKRYRHNPKNAKSLDRNWTGEVYVDRSGILWVGTGLLSQFDRQTEEFTHFAFTSNYQTDISNAAKCLYEDRSNILWISTLYNGLLKLGLGPKKFAHYQHDAGNPNSLGGNSIRSLYEDKSGMIWIALYNDGVNRFDPRTEQFTHFKHDPKDPSSLGHNYVRTICEDRSGNLWFGTEAGLDRFDPRTGRITRVLYDKPPDTGDHPGRVMTICEDRAGTLWFGTWSRGLYKIVTSAANGFVPLTSAEEAPSRVSFQRFGDHVSYFAHYKHNPKDSTSVSDDRIGDIHEDRFGNFWVATGNGINLMDRQTGKFMNANRWPEAPSNGGRIIYEDKSGILWVPSNLGLGRIEVQTKGAQRYKIVPYDQFLRQGPFHALWCLYEDRFGIIWVGEQYGLLKLDPTAQKFMAHYSEKDGLATNLVQEIVGDNEGNLWLLTGKGLSIFNENGKQFRNFDSKDGVINSPTAAKGLLKAKDGTIYWGGSNGLHRFFPENLKNNPHVPPVVLTEFRLFNEVVKLDSAISAKKQITLGHDQNSFSFSFAALDFTRPLSNQYAYRLEGVDEDWIEVGNRRYANYTHIPPGKYTFRVKGSNNDGVWNEEGASVRLIITPPWWKTWWAYALYVILLGATLYGIRQFEMNRVHLRNELKLKNFEAKKLQEVDQMKSRFFANISHEFRTPLTLILGPIDSVISRTVDELVKNKLEIAWRNARQLLRLINQLLDLSKIEAGSMALKARPANFIPFLKNLVFSFESLAGQKEIVLEFRSTLEEIEIYFEPEKLEKVFYNLLSNAFKFTAEGGKISVVVNRGPRAEGLEQRINGDERDATPRPSALSPRQMSDYVEISIRDTGIGISAEELPRIFDRFYQVDSSHTREHEGTGIGLALAKELLELHHGEITVTSEVGAGTEFVVKLPIGAQHLQPGEMIEEAAPFLVKSDYLTRPSEDLLASPIAPPAPATAPATALVLVVEDNADVRSYIREHLEEQYKIFEAENGVEGLEKAAENMPDLIISDVMMPRMDGFEFCRKIRIDEKTSHIPVILLTARASGESKIAGLETGADDYLTKPFDARELQARVRNLIEQRRRLRERFGREVTLQPRDLALTSMDEKFLQRAMAIVEEYLADSDFTVELFSQKAGMSRVHLNRKLKALTDHSANDFIRTLRLNRAAQLLQAKSATVLEIAYEVGFNNPSYFAECFRKQFGKSPSQYASQ